MRLKVWDRMLAALAGIIILILSVGLFVFGTGIFPFRLDLSFLDRTFEFWQRAVMVVAALALCLLGLHGISMLFRSAHEKGFILQHTEYGDLSISMTAMENMVRRCVDSHNELKVSSTRIHHARDGVIINMRISLANGVNIPLAVSALQKQIKQYITSCSGVDVKEVRVMVETNNNLATNSSGQAPDTLMADVDAVSKAGVVADGLHVAAQNAMPAETTEPPKPEKAPFHQRLFRREEKQQIIPQPPEEVSAVAEAAATGNEAAKTSAERKDGQLATAETHPAVATEPESGNVEAEGAQPAGYPFQSGLDKELSGEEEFR